MFMLVKLLSVRGVALPELMFWRQFVTLPLLFGWLAARGQLGELKTLRLKDHGKRAVMGTIGMICNFGAAIWLPLAVATVLGFTTPLFAVMLTAFLLAERVGPWRWAAVVIGFLGVLIIEQPGSAASFQMPLHGAIAGLGAGFMVAIISLHIRDLTRTDTPISVVFYFALFGSMIVAPILPFVMTAHTGRVWLELLALGVVGTVAQVLLTAALRYGSAASVLVMDYTSLVWTTLFGLYIFGQLPPDHMWRGAPLIVVAGLVIAWREHRLHKLNQRILAEAEAGAQ
jgi:drug/metabolite transporter (DMT)-like permease